MFLLPRSSRLEPSGARSIIVWLYKRIWLLYNSVVIILCFFVLEEVHSFNRTNWRICSGGLFLDVRLSFECSNEVETVLFIFHWAKLIFNCPRQNSRKKNSQRTTYTSILIYYRETYRQLIIFIFNISN